MSDLTDTWEDLINIVSMNITLAKFSEGSYDEDWDEGTKQYTDYTVPARVKYDLSERDLELLGEEMLLDAIVIIRKKDLDGQSLQLASQDHIKIDTKEYRITKMQPKIVKGELVGYIIGVKEVL